MSLPSRAALGVVAAVGAAVLNAGPAFAHSEFQPESAPAGEVVAVELFVENEQTDAGTVKVQLHFPEDQPTTLAALPASPGWTATAQGGTVGRPVTDVTW
jgi:uncharacterized protein YcnI